MAPIAAKMRGNLLRAKAEDGDGQPCDWACLRLPEKRGPPSGGRDLPSGCMTAVKKERAGVGPGEDRNITAIFQGCLERKSNVNDTFGNK